MLKDFFTEFDIVEPPKYTPQNFIINLHNLNTQESVVVNHVVNLENYKDAFNKIIILLTHSFFKLDAEHNLENNTCTLFENKKVVTKGYIYNTTTLVKKDIFVLSLVKLHSELSDAFNLSHTNFSPKHSTQTKVEMTQTEVEMQLYQTVDNYSKYFETESAEIFSSIPYIPLDSSLRQRNNFECSNKSSLSTASYCQSVPTFCQVGYGDPPPMDWSKPVIKKKSKRIYPTKDFINETTPFLENDRLFDDLSQENPFYYID